MPRPTRSEAWLLAGAGLLCVAAALAPALPQDPAYHRFADTRTLLGAAWAMDVLSSGGFVLAGLWGLALAATRRLFFFSAALERAAVTFFVGFVLTGLGSARYHASPDDAGLAWDRLGMVVAFAGVLGMAAAHRISDRAGTTLLAFALLAGPASVAWWVARGSVTPYAVLQFGGLLAVVGCLLAAPRGVGPRWAGLLAAYALAKVAEHFDAELFALSGRLVSGHTLKHLLATLPALAVIRPLRAAARAGRRTIAAARSKSA